MDILQEVDSAAIKMRRGRKRALLAEGLVALGAMGALSVVALEVSLCVALFIRQAGGRRR